MDNIVVAGITVAPGTRQRHEIELVELADGTKVCIPLDIIHGSAPGPRLYLGAAIHGDEVDGVAILFRALANIDPATLRGSIVCVPVQHPLSFHADHRLPISQFMKSPLDQAPADAWACFPGDADGNLAQSRNATGLLTFIPQHAAAATSPSRSCRIRIWATLTPRRKRWHRHLGVAGSCGLTAVFTSLTASYASKQPVPVFPPSPSRPERVVDWRRTWLMTARPIFATS